MRIYKCDRCGAMFKSSLFTQIRGIRHDGQEMSIKIHWESKGVSADLCDACRKSAERALTDWWNHED